MTGHSPTPASTLQRLLRLRRGPWENLATVVIALGIVMLMQPFSATAYAYSFVTILAGTVSFTVVSHFPE
ncbi:MAG: hypothetical protein AB1586_17460 [Pseudomonadota bacterium]|jgi:uncharacterized membrane protein YjjP (DUF1212 family)